jgi:hypothetical protein
MPTAKPSIAKRPLRGANRFRKREVARVFAAAKAAELPVERVDIYPATGRISVIVGKPGDADQGNDLDRWMAQKNARQA